MSEVVEAEATSTTEAEATTKAAPAVTAKPQEGEAVKAKAEKPDAKESAKPAAKAIAKAEPEPEQFAFKDKDGKVIEGDPVLDEFAALANENKWTADVANQQFERLSKANEKLMSNAKAALAAAWDKELRADKVLGGEKFDENIGAIKNAVGRLEGGVDLYAALVKDGLDRHPPTVRLLHRFAQAISPDKFTAGVAVTGRPGDIANPNDTSVAAFAQDFKGSGGSGAKQ